MHSNHRKAKKKFTNKIAIADRIETVLTDARKPELARDQLAVEDDCRSSQRGGTEWQNIGSHIAITETFRVALECFDLRQQIMRQENWLGTLQMGVTGHDNIDMLLGEIEQRRLQYAKTRADPCNLRFPLKA